MLAVTQRRTTRVQHSPASAYDKDNGLSKLSAIVALVNVIANTVCFAPGPIDCAQFAAGQIDQAQKTISIQAFQFTEPNIAQSVLKAKARGVQVRIIVDKKAPGEKNGQTLALAAAGIPVWVDEKPHIAHNKVIILDDGEVIGGSFNYTTNADRYNADNMTVTFDSQIADQYERNFNDRLAASETLADY